jgi:multimeric flavodoxin WrbA
LISLILIFEGMKVLGIVAGPRKNGNTAKLVEEVINGAKEAGHKTYLFYLSEMQISPLKADLDGYVYPNDDFEELMPHLETMDALILGTPVYYDHVSTRAKLFIDRLYYYSKSHGAEYRKLFPKDVKFISIITYGWDNPNAYDEVATWLNDRMSHYWDMKIYGTLKAHGTGNNPVKDNKKLLEKARLLGKNL